MGIEIWFAQALGMKQYVEPAAFPVPPVVGDFDIFYSIGIDILLHGTQVEKHGSLEVVEEHAVSFFEAVVVLGRNNKSGPVGILEKSFLSSSDNFSLLRPDEDE